ncbi:hypothetical protein LINPERPRIM_LOCUS5198, partial [Linum perenne]
SLLSLLLLLSTNSSTHHRRRRRSTPPEGKLVHSEVFSSFVVEVGVLVSVVEVTV